MDAIGLIELPGSTYLYALAFIAIVFVGFSSVAVVIRQTIGVGLTRFQALLAYVYIELGFLVVGLSLFPVFLSLFALPHSFVLRVSSAAAGLVLVVWLGIFFRRYRKIRPTSFPASGWVHLAIAVVVLGGLLMNAAGYPREPHVGLYALALCFILVEAIDTFLDSMNIFLRQSKVVSRPNESTKN